MEQEFKCMICGVIGVTFLLINTNPICEECLKHIIHTPHTEIQIPINPSAPYNNIINIATTATTYDISGTP